MKQSQSISIGLVTAAAVGVMGIAATQNANTHRDCVNRNTGATVDQANCDQAHSSGYYGSLYNYRYRSSDGTTRMVDAGDRSAVAAADSRSGITRGGFGSSGYESSGS